MIAWTPVSRAKPTGRLVLVKTRRGTYHLHPMVDRAGNLHEWDDQPEKWTDGKFDYDEVEEWVKIA